MDHRHVNEGTYAGAGSATHRRIQALSSSAIPWNHRLPIQSSTNKRHEPPASQRSGKREQIPPFKPARGHLLRCTARRIFVAWRVVAGSARILLHLRFSLRW